MENNLEERLTTVECIMAELGYDTVRSPIIGSVQVIIGEVRILADDVELVLMSENNPTWGYRANLLCRDTFVASVNRWIDYD